MRHPGVCQMLSEMNSEIDVVVFGSSLLQSGEGWRHKVSMFHMEL